MAKIDPVLWRGGALEILDQLKLPAKTAFLKARTPEQVAKAIRDMNVRGAPLIGVAGAYGMALAARRAKTPASLRKALARASIALCESRPTAVALRHAVDRLHAAGLRALSNGSGARALLAEAKRVHREAIDSDRRTGELGAKLLPRHAVLMTICNTGTLATAGIGTALGVARTARRRKGVRMIYALETRPYLQGARLTAWELLQDRAPFRLITDGTAGHILATEKVHAVLAGADRIAANGDTANKIGTYPLAVLAERHRVPFYIVAPVDTIDWDCPSGKRIPIEERSSKEVVEVGGKALAPKGTKARHPAFDVTPAELITAVVTERGVVKTPTRAKLARLRG